MSKAILKRRTLLKQLGAAAFLATPVFRSVLAEAQTAFPLRLILLNLPGGIPYKAGADGTPDFFFDTLAKPFAALESDMIVIDGAESPASEEVSAFYELEGHGGGCRTMFGGKGEGQGCNGPNACGTSEADAYGYGTATTIDQIVADQVGTNTKFRSIGLGTLWDKGQGGDHAECFFKNGQPVRPFGDPLVAFTQIFGGGTPPPVSTTTGTSTTPTAPDPALINQYARGRSRLDQLLAEVNEIKSIAGTNEQAKLDQHLTSLRELEKSLVDPNAGPGGGGGIGVMPGGACATPATPGNGAADDIRTASAAFNAIGYQAINCDLTRVLDMQWLSSGDHLPRFEWMGLKLDHHGMEHGSSRTEYAAAQTWIFQEMANFLTLLKTTPEGSGNMLDNSVVYMTSEMSEGNHVHNPVLQFVAGKGGGQFRTGRRLDATGKTNNDVLLALVKAMGVNATTVGDAKYNNGAISLA